MDAYFKIHGKLAMPIGKKIIDSFRSEMCIHGICSISEVYDGDPPQRPNGSISQAWSVAEILRILKMIEKYQN